MLLTLLLCIPIIGIFIISAGMSYDMSYLNTTRIKQIALTTSIINLFISLLVFFYLIIVVINFNLLKNIMK